ncbi:hypothetical protein EXIGLDRAFT_769901 [Exidia glandulosa HHB12029]|uniref:Uncharacterized protein n=1 Tax=Exidia glandulosa HHB12029 TaxID=1314781 RepID=A0A165H4Z6_EXIGL|nr:hypothetical protein EXIGLDRAFT_769901 [Exidia glandulosa HHB12029]
MPRYSSDQERQDARRRTRREYYARNRESERARARERWSRRTDAPATRRERVRAAAPSAQRILLPATSAHLGEGLQIHDARTDLKQVLVTLQQDLRGWSGNLHLATIHDQLALKLIDAEQRKRRSQKLQRELLIKIQHATFVYDVASDAMDAAISQRGLRSKLVGRLDALATEAYDLKAGVEEMVLLSDLDNGSLKREYNEGRLSWQRRYADTM